jgi:hypothetical protein
MTQLLSRFVVWQLTKIYQKSWKFRSLVLCIAGKLATRWLCKSSNLQTKRKKEAADNIQSASLKRLQAATDKFWTFSFKASTDITCNCYLVWVVSCSQNQLKLPTISECSNSSFKTSDRSNLTFKNVFNFAVSKSPSCSKRSLGYSSKTMTLQRWANVFKRVCGKNDIIIVETFL